ncbi:ORF1 [nege-like virus 1]|nr:ORF1 [nege-like virus 1]
MAHLTQYLGIDPELLRNAVVDRVLNGEPTSNSSPLQNVVFGKVATEVEGQITNYSNKKSVVIHESLTIEQQSLLISRFPEYYISFKGDRLNNHGLAAAVRTLEHHLLLDYVNYDADSNYVPEGYDDYVCDVGGNFSTHIKMGRTRIHCCNPLLDYRDVARRRLRIAEVMRFLTSKDGSAVVSEETLKRLTLASSLIGKRIHGDADNELFCDHKAQNCSRTAQFGIGIHANYDISLRELGDMMTKKKMEVYYFSMMYSDRILCEASGEIEGVNCHFKHSEDNKYIEFSFKHDNSLTYRHRTDIYHSYIFTNTFTDSNGKTYIMEQLDNRLGVSFFRVCLTDIKPKSFSMSTAPLLHNVWLKDYAEYTKVKFYDIDYNAMAVGDVKGTFRERKFFVKTEIVNKLMSMAYSCTEKKFKPVEIFGFLMTYTSKIFFGSDVVVRAKSLPADIGFMLANAVYLYVYQKKYDFGKVLEQLKHDIDYDRELAPKSWWGKLFHSRPKNVFGQDEGMWGYNLNFLKSLKHLVWASTRSRRDPSDLIEESIKFFPCDRPEKQTFFFGKRDTTEPGNIVSMTFPSVLVDETVVSLDKIVKQVVMQSFGKGGTVTTLREEPVDLKVISVPALVEKKKKFYIWTTVAPGIEFCEAVEACEEEDDSVSIVTSVPSNNGLPEETINLLECDAASASLEALRYRIFSMEESEYKQRKAQVTMEPPGPIVVCRAEAKLQDMLSKYLRGRTYDKALDLCAGPGGFIKTLSENCVQVFAHYYKDAKEGSKLNHDLLGRLQNSRNLVLYDTELSDLTEPLAVESLLTVIGKTTFDIITADGAIHDDTCCDMEVVNEKLIASECRFIECLNPGGVFILKTFGFNGDTTKNIIAKTFSTFSKVYYERSRFASAISSEVYIVGVGYGMRTKNVTRNISELSKDMTYYSMEFRNRLHKAYREFLCLTDEDAVEETSSIVESTVTQSSIGSSVRTSNTQISTLDSLPRDTDVVFVTNKSTLQVGKMLGLDMEKPFRKEHGVKVLTVGECNLILVNSGELVKEFTLVINKIPEITESKNIAFVLDQKVKPVSDFSFVEVSLPYLASVLRKTVDVYRVKSQAELKDWRIFCASSDKAESTIYAFEDTSSNATESDDLYFEDGKEKRHKIKESEVNNKNKFLYEDKFSVESVDEGIGTDVKINKNKIKNVNQNVNKNKNKNTNKNENETKDKNNKKGKNENINEIENNNGNKNKNKNKNKNTNKIKNKNVKNEKGNENIQEKGNKKLEKKNHSEDEKTEVEIASCVSVFEDAMDKPLTRCDSGIGSVNGTGVASPVSTVPSLSPSARKEGSADFDPLRVKKCRGDGNCGFYALMGGHNNDPQILKTLLFKFYKEKNLAEFESAEDIEEGLAESGLCNCSILSLFSRKYKAEVKVSGELVMDINKKEKFPLFKSSVIYRNGHYDILLDCPLDGIQEKGDRCFNYEEVDVAEVFEYTKKIFSLGSELKDITKERKFFPSADKIYFYNGVYNFCGVHGQCKNQNFNFVTKQFETAGYKGTVFFLLDLLNLNNNFYKSVNHQIKFYNCLNLLKKNYVLCSVFFGQPRDYTRNGFKCLQELRNHAKHCQAEEGPLVLSVNKDCYCYCGDIPRIYRVEELTTSVIFEFFVDDNCSDIRFVKGKYLVPVTLDNSGRIVRNDSKYRELFKKFFSLQHHYNVGFNVGNYFGGRYILQLLLDYVSYIDVIAKDLDRKVHRFGESPRFLNELTDEDYCINAFNEYKQYVYYSWRSVMENVKNYHDRVMSNLKIMQNGGEMVVSMADYGLMDMATGRMVVKPTVPFKGTLNYAYDGNSVVSISKCYDKKGQFISNIMSGYYSVCREFLVFNTKEIYDSMDNLDEKNLQTKLKFELINGVPGCGKTYYIVEKHDATLNLKEIVLTATKEAAIEIRDRVAKKYNYASDEKMLGLKYRTVDSLLMHARSLDYSEVSTIWLDEGLMLHFGNIVAVGLKLNCFNIKICGDTAQIPFVNRMGIMSLKYGSLLGLADLSIVERAMSYRVPADVVCFINKQNYYPMKMVTSNKVNCSITTRLIKNATDINLNSEWIILTFTQGEKFELEKQFNGRGFVIHTVHEFQGKQGKKIALVRIVDKDLEIYKQKPWRLVGITRHTEEFQYLTTTRDEFLVLLSQRFSEADMNQARLKGGGELSSFCATEIPLGFVEEEEDENPNNECGGSVAVEDLRDQDSEKEHKVFFQHPFFHVNVKSTRTVDKLNQNRRYREFVEEHFGCGIKPLRPVSVPIYVYTPPRKYSQARRVHDPLTLLQFAYDDIFPGAGLVETRYDGMLFEQDDFYVKADNFSIDFTQVTRKPHFDCLTSKLRTACPKNVTMTPKQCVKAFMERNGAVPNLQGIVNQNKVVDHMMDCFIDTYVADKELFSTYIFNPVCSNVDDIEIWLQGQPPGVWDMVERADYKNVFDSELRRYNFILKRMPKPKLVIGAEYKYPSPQTIAHHEKNFNALFCPIIKALKNRLLAVLKYDKVLNMDMSPEDLEDLLTVRFPDIDDYKYRVEIDMSKYDKSRESIGWAFGVRMLGLLGFPLDLLGHWGIIQVFTVLHNILLRFSARVMFQQKSGSPDTLSTNTVFLLAVLAMVFNENIEWKNDVRAKEKFLTKKPVYYKSVTRHFYEAPDTNITSRLKNAIVLAVGDDSYIYSKEYIDVNEITRRLALIFNLEGKILTHKTAYFCSKFLFNTWDSRFYLVPDFAKVLTKLGRSDLVNEDHVECYRRSLVDNCKAYGNELLYPYIDLCMQDRYGVKGSYVIYYRALWTFINDKEAFHKNYYARPQDTINEFEVFNNLPSLDI